MDMEQMFFELLQVAIGTRQSLSVMPTSQEWALLLEMAKKQSLVAIAFNGVSKLNTESDFGATIGIPEVVYLKWLGLVAKTAQRNKELNKQCKELCDKLKHDGFCACVLKGQANYDLYPESLRDCRTPGDIDVWVRPNGETPIALQVDVNQTDFQNHKCNEAVIQYVMMNTPEEMREAVKNDMRQHHIDYRFFENTEVEVHFTPSYFQSPLKNRRLQRWFELHGEDCCTSSLGFKVGSVGFNAVYQLIHVYKHLFTEGIGLRQLLDYYFVLRALHIEQGTLGDSGQSMGQLAEGKGYSIPSNEEIMHTLGRFGMSRFAGAVMWVIAKVFTNENENEDWQKRWPWMICEPNEKAGRFLLDEIMQAGNFGKYDERNRRMQGASKLKRFFLLSQRNWRFFKQYPSEVFWDPFRRAYNVIWRKLELWKF